jgi:hypothetical protein
MGVRLKLSPRDGLREDISDAIVSSHLVALDSRARLAREPTAQA